MRTIPFSPVLVFLPLQVLIFLPVPIMSLLAHVFKFIVFLHDAELKRGVPGTPTSRTALAGPRGTGVQSSQI